MKDESEMEMFEISPKEMVSFVSKLCDFGEKSGYEPQQFAALLTIASKYLNDKLGVRITGLARTTKREKSDA